MCFVTRKDHDTATASEVYYLYRRSFGESLKTNTTSYTFTIYFTETFKRKNLFYNKNCGNQSECRILMKTNANARLYTSKYRIKFGRTKHIRSNREACL